MLVLEEGERSFNSKTGPKKEYVVSIRDAGQGERCTNNFVYSLNDEEKDRY
ncbi:MAG: hypothetical protein HZA90_07685, partial [Verrucomicrobia bacterium]|nr:hypothetical protein [Verrucomicrobiota bacterium]